MAREHVRKAWIFRGRVYAFTKSGKFRHPFTGSDSDIERLLSRVQSARSLDPERWDSMTSDLDLTPLLKGRANCYAVPDGDTRLKVSVQRGDNGWIYVHDAAVYGRGQEYGIQTPGNKYEGKIIEQLRAILADPKAAALEYAKLTSRCGVCNRPLENEESVARGMGPVCASKWGG